MAEVRVPFSVVFRAVLAADKSKQYGSVRWDISAPPSAKIPKYFHLVALGDLASVASKRELNIAFRVAKDIPSLARLGSFKRNAS